MNVENLFLDKDRLLIVRTELAELIGLNEAIVLNQINYFCEKSNNVRDGHRWIYNSFENWQKEHFPFWSLITVKRIFKSLENKGIIVTGCYNKMKVDKTKWYRIDYEKLQEYVDENNCEPHPKKPYPKNKDTVENNDTYTENVAENTETSPSYQNDTTMRSKRYYQYHRIHTENNNYTSNQASRECDSDFEVEEAEREARVDLTYENVHSIAKQYFDDMEAHSATMEVFLFANVYREKLGCEHPSVKIESLVAAMNRLHNYRYEDDELDVNQILEIANKYMDIDLGARAGVKVVKRLEHFSMYGILDLLCEKTIK